MSDTLAAVLRDEPDWTAVPADVPLQVQTLVRRALVKDRAARMSDISVARFLLSEPAASTGVVAPPAPEPSRRRGRRMAYAVAGVAAGILLFVVIAQAVVGFRPGPQPQTMRFVIMPPAGQPVALRSYDRELAISPDGTRIVYTAREGSGVVADGPSGGPARRRAPSRHRSAALAVRVTGWKVDWLLRRRRVAESADERGSAHHALQTCRPAARRELEPRRCKHRLRDRELDRAAPRVSRGRRTDELTTVAAAEKDQKHWFPFVLPNGKAVLYTATTGAGIPNANIAVLDLATGARKILIRGGSNPEYASTGHIVYAVDGALRAVRFDAGRLEVVGEPAPVVEQVTTMSTGAANYALSANGTLIYLAGGVSRPVTRNSLVWVTRQGREEPITAPERAYHYPRLSPDGTRIALDVRDQEEDIWVWELRRKMLTRLTFDRASDQYPVWTPDGRRIIFGSARAGTANLYAQLSDGTGEPERLTTSVRLQHPHSISPDGTRIVFREEGGASGVDLMALVQDGERRSEPLVVTQAAELNAEVSPNGRWLAYESNESGRPRFTCGRSRRWTAGGGRFRRPAAGRPPGRETAGNCSSSTKTVRSSRWPYRPAVRSHRQSEKTSGRRVSLRAGPGLRRFRGRATLPHDQAAAVRADGAVAADRGRLELARGPEGQDCATTGRAVHL